MFVKEIDRYEFHTDSKPPAHMLVNLLIFLEVITNSFMELSEAVIEIDHLWINPTLSSEPKKREEIMKIMVIVIKLINIMNILVNVANDIIFPISRSPRFYYICIINM